MYLQDLNLQPLEEITPLDKCLPISIQSEFLKHCVAQQHDLRAWCRPCRATCIQATELIVQVPAGAMHLHCACVCTTVR